MRLTDEEWRQHRDGLPIAISGELNMLRNHLVQAEGRLGRVVQLIVNMKRRQEKDRAPEEPQG